MTAIDKILDALASGAATAEDICDLTGIPTDSCRAHLSELRRMGCIRKVGEVVREVVQARKAALYGLAGAANSDPATDANLNAALADWVRAA